MKRFLYNKEPILLPCYLVDGLLPQGVFLLLGSKRVVFAVDGADRAAGEAALHGGLDSAGRTPYSGLARTVYRGYDTSH